MQKNTKNQFSRLFALTFLLSLSLLGTFSTVAQAQNKSIYTNKKNQVTFQPPKGDKPQQTIGGASRGGQCIGDSQELISPIIPLLPANSQAFTVKSHPTLLVHVPQTSATKAYFAVRDESEDYDYQTILPIGNKEGIINLTLPKDAPDLSVNKDYQWSLVLMCDGKLRPDSPVAKGNIRRIASNNSMTQQLNKADLLESAAIYGQAGIWYDTVASLAELKNSQPNNDNVSNNWENLLKTVGLERVAQAKFVE